MNQLEARTASVYEKEGWQSLRKGWPDFLFFRTAPSGVIELLAVEVKSCGSDLHGQQWDVLDKLAQVMPVRVVRELSNGSLIEKEFNKEWGECGRGRRIDGR